MNKDNFVSGYIYNPDPRNKAYPLEAYLPEAPTALPAEYIDKVGSILDQGRTPRCVGFGSRQFLASEPGFLMSKAPTPLAIYRGAQKVDGIPGKHDGSTVLGAMKYLSNRGLIGTYAWANGIDTIRRWVLGGKGGVLIGINWLESMFTPDAEHVIHATGAIAGGHCLLICGASDTRQQFRLCNSWGQSWGDGGECWISYTDMGKLLAEQGEAATPVQVTKHASK